MSRASLDKDPRDVATMFDDVASKYDVTNDVLSLGQDRLWRRAVVQACEAVPGQVVLDIAAGAGDQTGEILRRLKFPNEIIDTTVEAAYELLKQISMEFGTTARLAAGTVAAVRFGVDPADAIDKAEDRERFREAMTKIGLDTPKSHHVKTLGAALDCLDDIGLPAIIRPAAKNTAMKKTETTTPSPSAL